MRRSLSLRARTALQIAISKKTFGAGLFLRYK